MCCAALRCAVLQCAVLYFSVNLDLAEKTAVTEVLQAIACSNVSTFHAISWSGHVYTEDRLTLQGRCKDNLPSVYVHGLTS